MNRALLQQALDVFEGAYRDVLLHDAIPSAKLLAIITALRAALAQPQAEPVALLEPSSNYTIAIELMAGMSETGKDHWRKAKTIPLYATPQQAQPAPAAPAVQPLTDEQIEKIRANLWPVPMDDYELESLQEFARAIEQAHGIAAPGSADHG